jgi:hypothetical protein
MLAQMKTVSRLRIRRIWEAWQRGDKLEGEELILAAIMNEHDEWHAMWARADEVNDAELEEEGGNPFLHIVMHQIVKTQMDGELPVARATFETLIERGFDAHEAVHRIAAVLVEELHTVLSRKRSFNEARYVRKLKTLARKAKP